MVMVMVLRDVMSNRLGLLFSFLSFLIFLPSCPYSSLWLQLSQRQEAAQPGRLSHGLLQSCFIIAFHR